MKKRKFVIFIFAFILISNGVLAVSIEPCHNFYMRGDSNNDGIIDISDPIKTLSFLYYGGEAPLCSELADVNGDTQVDISDVIYILNYLYNAGTPPQTTVAGVSQIEYYGEGADDAPELGFLGVEEDNVRISEIPSVIEVVELTSEKPKKIEGSLLGSGDIVSCKADIYEDNTFLSTTFQAEWLEGSDLTSNSLEILIGDNDGVVVEKNERRYSLYVTCTDMSGQSRSTVMTFTTKEHDPIPLEPNCRKDIDVCCYSDDIDIVRDKISSSNPFSTEVFDADYSTVKGRQWSCSKDCDTEVEMLQDGTMKKICDGPVMPSCANIEKRDVVAGFDTRTGEQVPREWNPYDSVDLCNNLENENVHPPIEDAVCVQSVEINPAKFDKEQENIQFLADEPTPSKSPCYVDSMTIYRKPEDYKNNVNNIKDDFKLVNYFIPQNQQANFNINGRPLPVASDVNNNYNWPLGPMEGWMTFYNSKKELAGYSINYEFLTYSELTPGSKHENCLKAQFAQGESERTEIADGEWVLGNFLKKIGKTPLGQKGTYTHDFNKIYTKSLKDIDRITYSEDVRKNEMNAKYYIYELKNNDWVPYTKYDSEEQKTIEAIKATSCRTDGVWCSDDYSGQMWAANGRITTIQPDNVDSDFLRYVPEKRIAKMFIPSGGLCYTQPPKIIWVDRPGWEISKQSFKTADLLNGVLPWPGPYKYKRSFISFVEDSGPRAEIGNPDSGKKYQYRWACKLSGLEFIRNNNVDLKSGDPSKMRRVTTTIPSCECIRQRRVPDGLYEDEPATKKIC